MGVYHISEMLHLLGNPGVLRVSGRTFQKVELDELRAQAGRYSVEELGCGFVNFANGALLEIAEAWAIHLDSFEGSFIVGDKGGIRLRPFSLHQLQIYLNLISSIQMQTQPFPYFNYKLI
jgi:predicted dehydrogenase